MSSEETINELDFNNKWLSDETKNSKWYLQYLDSVFDSLKNNIKC